MVSILYLELCQADQVSKSSLRNFTLVMHRNDIFKYLYVDNIFNPKMFIIRTVFAYVSYA